MAMFIMGISADNGGGDGDGGVTIVMMAVILSHTHSRIECERARAIFTPICFYAPSKFAHSTPHTYTRTTIMRGDHSDLLLVTGIRGVVVVVVVDAAIVT